MNYLNSYSLDAYENSAALRLAQGNKYLPANSIVLNGDQIFNIFFEGTTMDDCDSKGRQFKTSIETEWNDIQAHFDSALQDIADTTQNQVKTQLQNWFDVLKKVMSMWATGLGKSSKTKEI